MNFINSKYRNHLSRIFLTVYIISLLAGILHYHHCEYSNVAAFESGSDKLFSHFQLVGANNYECIIQHNVIDLQSSLLTRFTNDGIITQQKVSYQNLALIFPVKLVHLTNNLLRAPPSLS